MTSPAFTLQTLSFHLQSQLRSLEVVYALTSKLVQLSNPVMDETGGESDSDNDAFEAIVNELKGGGGGGRQDIGIAKGGEVLAVISDLMDKTPGDPIALSLYSGLLLRASQPYATILLGWISTGHLSDPWEEFMVRENKAITKGQLDRDYTDEYWDRRYTLRDAGVKKKRVTISADGTKGKESDDRSRGLSGGAIVPKFLEKWKSKILLAGKYLNVIRECGIEIKIADDGVRGGAVEGVEGMALNDELYVLSSGPCIPATNCLTLVARSQLLQADGRGLRLRESNITQTIIRGTRFGFTLKVFLFIPRSLPHHLLK